MKKPQRNRRGSVLPTRLVEAGCWGRRARGEGPCGSLGCLGDQDKAEEGGWFRVGVGAGVCEVVLRLDRALFSR